MSNNSDTGKKEHMVDLATKRPEFKEVKNPFDIESYWKSMAAEHLRVAEQTFNSQYPVFEEWVKTAEEAIKRGNKLIFFGNGGSAADSQHIVAEMSIKLRRERSPIAALSLSLDASAITACANDYGFDQIFSRQIRTLGYGGDVAVGLSTSGNSDNILKGLKKAKRMDMITVGLTGESGGKMQSHCDLLLKVPSTDPARIQEMHITFGHMFVGALEERLGLV